MKNYLSFLTKLFVSIFTLTFFISSRALAFNVFDGVSAARAEGVPAELVGDTGFITRLTTILLAGIGVVSVIVLIYGGFRYIISSGDAKKVTDAKNTILYAIVGLIIALLSYAIINFVVYAVTGQTNSDAIDNIQESSQTTPTPSPTPTPTEDCSNCTE
ncbi:MAG: hypothetical protein Q4F60_00695 [Candidatus Saccharibacteria bacterium]|nr:hypothetical protein [Candidatus Saccharibacteria bacterium]